MRKAAAVWLLGWALFGFPWAGGTATPHFEHVNLVPFTNVKPSDVVRNFVYYVPVGLIGVRAGFAPTPIVVAAAALSATTEISQVYSTDRYPTITDFALNTGGAMSGVVLMTLFQLLGWRLRTAGSISRY